MPASWDKMPSYESFVANQIGAPQPSAGMENQIPAVLGFGAGDFTSDDFAGFNTGPNPNDLAFNYSLWGGSNNTVNPYGADVSGQNYYMPGLDFNYSMPGFGYSNFFNTPGAGDGYGGGLLGGSTKIDAPTILDRFTVSGTDLSDLRLLNFDPNAPYFGPRNPFQLDPTDGGAGIVVNTSSTTGPVTMTPFTVSDTVVTTPSVELTGTPEPGGGNVFTPATTGTGPVILPTFTVSEDRISTTPPVTTGTGPVVLPTFTVSENRISTPPATTGTGPVILPTFTVTEIRFTSPDISVFFTTTPPITLPSFTFTTPVITTPPVTTPRTTTAMPTTTPIVSTGGGGGGGTTPSTSGTAASSRRNLKAELEESMRALRANQGDITGMYKDLYNAFMPEGLNAAEASSLAQMRADEEKLARLRAGILSPEDVRTGQQAAREAYAARGQIMGPGAIGAEIYNRENIRQAREDAARAAYQQSMGNVLNTANLKTGNIFQPISSLISNTFNPLGTYPADVYGTNVNADLAREIAQKNYEAAVRSAELSGSAAKSASNKDLLATAIQVGGTVKIIMSCMPGDQVIDTPSGPKPIEDIRGGDEVIGYDGSVRVATQVCSYVENPDREFFTFTLDDGRSLTVCGNHRIMDIPASEWVVGAKMGDREVKKIDYRTGVSTSYDLVTEIGGYQIAGVPVNSMIPEMLALTMSLVALKHA